MTNKTPDGEEWRVSPFTSEWIEIEVHIYPHEDGEVNLDETTLILMLEAIRKAKQPSSDDVEDDQDWLG